MIYAVLAAIIAALASAYGIVWLANPWNRARVRLRMADRRQARLIWTREERRHLNTLVKRHERLSRAPRAGSRPL